MERFKQFLEVTKVYGTHKDDHVDCGGCKMAKLFF